MTTFSRGGGAALI